jgi:hypothetical protein
MRHVAIFSCLILGLALFGCGGDKNPASPTDPAGAQAEAQLGDQDLAGGDIEGANAHYRAALDKDPNNPQANIGAAITEVYLLQNDPEVAQLLGLVDNPPVPIRNGDHESVRVRVERTLGFGDTRFQPLSPVKMVGRFTTLGTSDPIVFSDIQRVIKVKVMPKLQYAENRLNVVEANPTWRYLLLPEITEEPDTLEIDLGEVYALDAVVNAVQGWLGIVVAYDFDTPNGTANPESLLATGTAFGKLHLDGAAQLGAARNNWIHADTQLEAGIAFIDAETDDQSDDVIPHEALHSPEFLGWKEQFDALQTSLSAPVPVPVTNCSDVEVSVSVRIGSFFTNPIADLKTKLPAHTFDVDHEPVLTEPLDFPDPTFNGIFPNMTDEIWRTLICGPPPPALIARRH